MKAIIKASLCFLIVCLMGACNPYYHSVVSPLVIRQKPAIDGRILTSLRKFDNVNLIDSINGSWVYVKYYTERGYVLRDQIAPGRAIVVIRPKRIGAVCRDGTHVESTEEDACNGRGGIVQWRTYPETTVRIKN